MGEDVFQHQFLRERGRSPPLQEAHKLLGGWDLPVVTKMLVLAPKQPQPMTSSIQKHRPNADSQFWAALRVKLLLMTCLAPPKELMVKNWGRDPLQLLHKLPPQPETVGVSWTKPNRLK